MTLIEFLGYPAAFALVLFAVLTPFVGAGEASVIGVTGAFCWVVFGWGSLHLARVLVPLAKRLGGGMIEQKFSRSEFLGVDDDGRANLCGELAEVLSRRIRKSPAFGVEARACVAGLRALGHDLWSFDESIEFQIWGPNYARPTGPGILVTFTESEDVVVEWSKT